MEDPRRSGELVEDSGPGKTSATRRVPPAVPSDRHLLTREAVRQKPDVAKARRERRHHEDAFARQGLMSATSAVPSGVPSVFQDLSYPWIPSFAAKSEGRRPRPSVPGGRRWGPGRCRRGGASPPSGPVRDPGLAAVDPIVRPEPARGSRRGENPVPRTCRLRRRGSRREADRCPRPSRRSSRARTRARHRKQRRQACHARQQCHPSCRPEPPPRPRSRMSLRRSSKARTRPDTNPESSSRRASRRGCSNYARRRAKTCRCPFRRISRAAARRCRSVGRIEEDKIATHPKIWGTDEAAPGAMSLLTRNVPARTVTPPQLRAPWPPCTP